MKRKKTSELKGQSEPETTKGKRGPLLILPVGPSVGYELEVAPEVLPPAKLESQRPGRQTMMTCEYHPDIEFRTGGFCEKCYADKSMERMAKLDEALDTQVLDQIDILLKRVLDSKDDSLIERFLGRILNRFQRPTEHRISGQLKALHLVAGVDFGKRQ